MTEEPDEQLTVAVREKREAERLRERLVRAEEVADRATTEAKRLASVEADEREDVTKLESMSWSRILSGLRGSHASDLEREQAEAQRAAYEAGMALSTASTARREVESLRVELDRLGDVDTAYAEALSAKESWVAGHDETIGSRLHDIAVQKGTLSADSRELQEADDAGVTAHRHLVEAEKLLSSAESWASWDVFGGGGLITDAIKYDRLDQVQRELRQVDAALKAFSHELADVHGPAMQALDIDQLSTLFDVWFDNIFSDWAVRKRIVDAHMRVTQAVGQVYAAVQQLREQRRTVLAQIKALETERRGLLGG